MQETKCNQKMDGWDSSTSDSELNVWGLSSINDLGMWIKDDLSSVKINCDTLLLGRSKRIDLKAGLFVRFEWSDDLVPFAFRWIEFMMVWFIWKRGQKSTPIKGDQQINATTTTRNVSLAVLNSSLSWKNWYTLDAFRETLNESRLATWNDYRKIWK